MVDPHVVQRADDGGERGAAQPGPLVNDREVAFPGLRPQHSRKIVVE